MDKAKFFRTFNSLEKYSNIKYFAVGIKGVGEGVEVIVNPVCNLASKKEYYETAYNEKMELNTNKKIKVAFIAGLQSISDLRQVFEFEGL